VAITPPHFAETNIGRKRSHNEDCYAAEPALGLYVVCDGMGGGNAGEVASRMAIDAILDYVKAETASGCGACRVSANPDLSPETNQLGAAIRAANETVYRASWEHARYAGMGTTVVAARLTERYLSIAHVGDSRLYLIRKGAIQALTNDHSWVAEQVAKGYMTEEEAEHSPRRNVVTRALGVESTVDIDLAEIPIFNGDLLLLCSDGLTRGVRCCEILRTVEAAGDLCDKAGRLVSLANDAGGDDNITVVLVSVQGSASRRLWHRLAQRWFFKAPLPS
jgi:PPM family protein phosphatase